MNSNGFPTALWVVPFPEFAEWLGTLSIWYVPAPGFNLVVLAPSGKLTPP